LVESFKNYTPKAYLKPSSVIKFNSNTALTLCQELYDIKKEIEF